MKVRLDDDQEHEEPLTSVIVTSSHKAEKKAKDGLYVHPRVPGGKPIKVSCVACISGHRSGDCNHYDRILLKIRAAGRPSQTCHHPAGCDGACLAPRSYYVPDATPTWCHCHRQCILNWEYSETSPAYPASTKPTKQGKRKIRSPSPIADVKNLSKPTSCHTSIAFGGPTPAAKSCCSSQAKQPWANVIAQTHGPLNNPLMVVASHSPIGISCFHNVPGLQSFSPGRSPDHVTSGTTVSAAPTTSDLSSYMNMTMTSAPDISSFGLNTSSYPSQLPMGFDLSGYPSQDHGSASQREDAPPPSKRPCPGNGYQCPCDDDSSCVCEKCYTHGRGFWQGITSQFSTLETSQADFPPNYLLQEPSQPYEENVSGSVPELFDSTFTAHDGGGLGPMWKTRDDDEYDDGLVYPFKVNGDTAQSFPYL